MLIYNHPAAVARFLKGLNFKANLDGLSLLAREFLKFPYENITKIIRHKNSASEAERLRLPEIIMDEHEAYGAGGTCFSLTYFFETIMKELGFDCYPVMVDRSYGKNTHCAIIARLDGQKYLVDPGFCLSRPIPLLEQEAEYKLPHNTYVVTPACRPGHHDVIPAVVSGDLVNTVEFMRSPITTSGMTCLFGNDKRYTISTSQLGRTKPRYILKDAPVSPDNFLKFWEDSFNWPMMRHLCATKLSEDGFLYLRDSFVRATTHESKRQENIKTDYESRVAELFGIDSGIVKQAAELIY